MQFNVNETVVINSSYPGVDAGDIGTVVESNELITKVKFNDKKITQKVMTEHLSYITFTGTGYIVETTPSYYIVRVPRHKFSVNAWYASMCEAFGIEYANVMLPEYLKYDGLSADQIPMALPAEWFK